MQELSYGKSRPCADITLDDVLRYPIWVWALDEETVEGQDETWVKPVTNSTDVGEELAPYYPLVLYKIVGTEIYGLGDYDGRGLMTSGFWVAGRLVDENEIDALPEPILLEVVPTILGEAGVRFRVSAVHAYAWSAERVD